MEVGELETLFNDDDAEIKDGPESLTRRTEARMEAFLSSCAVALREDDKEMIEIDGAGGRTSVAEGRRGVNGGSKGKKKKKDQQAGVLDKPPGLAVRAISSASSAPRCYRQIDRGDLLYRLEIYCRT